MTMVDHTDRENGRPTPAEERSLAVRAQEEQIEADMDAIIAENLPALKELAK